MAGKQGGLGSNFYISGFDLSGNVNALSKISGGPAALDMTPINAFAYARAGGLRDGAMDFTTLFDSAAGQEHAALSPLPAADTIASFFAGPLGVGGAAASINCKQVDYNPGRAADGSLIFAVSTVANGFGLEWGVALTPGIRAYGGGAQFGPGLDTLASLSFGAQAYLHVVGFTGTDATVKIEDSADNSIWAAVAGFAFAQSTGTGSQRIAIANTATVREWVRASVTTAGGYSNLQFAVNLVKNPAAGVVF
jgi:hypothetical protein